MFCKILSTMTGCELPFVYWSQFFLCFYITFSFLFYSLFFSIPSFVAKMFSSWQKQCSSSYSYSIKPHGIYQFFCQGLSKIKGLHIKLWTSFFQLAFIAQRQCMQTINLRDKKQGSVTYSSDQENKISTIFI